jgi:hypothetical protein
VKYFTDFADVCANARPATASAETRRRPFEITILGRMVCGKQFRVGTGTVQRIAAQASLTVGRNLMDGFGACWAVHQSPLPQLGMVDISR